VWRIIYDKKNGIFGAGSGAGGDGAVGRQRAATAARGRESGAGARCTCCQAGGTGSGTTYGSASCGTKDGRAPYGDTTRCTCYAICDATFCTATSRGPA